MEEMNDKELCIFVKAAIETLEEKKKNEVMKAVGQFVYNPEIGEINKQIINFQNKCKHINVDGKGQCIYCKKQIESKR
ncbi:MAG: hypothetical protein IJE43_14675 [Alphaproteobacteria bacterium]|nr:hypothetical protein [Alphaproteobacteria bacterium]